MIRGIARGMVLALVLAAAAGHLAGGQQDSAERLAAMGKKVMELVNAADYEALESNFNAAMQAQLPLERTKTFFDGLRTSLGKIQTMDSPKIVSANKAQFLTHFERRSLEMTLTLDDQGKIAGLELRPASAPSTPAKADAPSPSANLSPAEKLFVTGKFAEAKAAFSEQQKAKPDDAQAALMLGHLALLENSLQEAEKWLTEAARLAPENKQAKALLAEALYRQDDFIHAAPLFRAAGQEITAKKLEGFGDRRPYELPKKEFEVHVKFLQTDPLPLVSVRVNGSEPVNFLIDTGGGELILSTDLAKQVGVAELGSTTGLLAAGPASIQNGRIDSLFLADLEVRNLPVKILERRYFAAGAPGKTVDGIIGTILLYHFVPTLDYVNGQLILRPRSQKVFSTLAELARKDQTITVPMWLAGDHFMLAWGSINDHGPMLWFVDTGLAGGGFVGTSATIKEAGIEGDAATAGAAVVTSSSTFVVQKLTLGAAEGRNITGFRGNLSGISSIQISGIVSHQFFLNYALTLDFHGMRLLLQKPSKRQPSKID